MRTVTRRSRILGDLLDGVLRAIAEGQLSLSILEWGHSEKGIKEGTVGVFPPSAACACG